VSTNHGNQAAVIYTSTGIAFLTFAGMILFHTIQGMIYQHITSGTWQRICSYLLPSEQLQDARAGSEEPLLQSSDGELSNQNEVAQPHRLYIMTSAVSLCLSMKMINDPSLYDMLVHIRPFFIKYVAAAIRISYDVLL